MLANIEFQDTRLVDAAAAWLRGRVPSSWRVEQLPSPSGEVDAMLLVRAESGFSTTIAVEAKQALSPRGVDGLLPSLGRQLRSMAGDVPVLIVAPWLSARTRERLVGAEMNYIDLTGNARLQLSEPALFIESEGASRDPQPAQRGGARVRGPKAARVLRLLADVSPPYGVREIAVATGLTPGYVSRLLDTLDREALLERSARGGVESVAVTELLRRWAETYDVLSTNEASAYLAPNGAVDALDRLGRLDGAGRPVVTGSFAARRLAPVAASTLLMAYSDRVEELAGALELLPADDGANVVLLRPFDEVAMARASEDRGVAYAAPSQVAVDCLTGTGRMPAEGEAVLAWMQESDVWRATSLASAAARAASEHARPTGETP